MSNNPSWWSEEYGFFGKDKDGNERKKEYTVRVYESEDMILIAKK